MRVIYDFSFNNIGDYYPLYQERRASIANIRQETGFDF